MMDEEENKIEKSDGLYLRIYDFLVQHPQLPEVALDSLTRLIGLVLHIHVAPIGINIEEYWESLSSGKSGVERISSFDVSKFSSQNL